MDSPSTQKNQFILFQGAILGGLNVLLLIILYKFDSLFNSGWSSLSWLIYFGFIPWSMIQFREKFLDGYISYGQSFVHGIKITILSGIIVGFLYFLVLKVIDPDLVKVLVVEMEEAYLTLGFTDKQVEEMSGAFTMVSNPWVLMFSGILGSLFYGVIVSLLVSFFVIRKGDPFKEAMKTLDNE